MDVDGAQSSAATTASYRFSPITDNAATVHQDEQTPDARPREPKPLDNCVICLQPVTERAIAVPCNHHNFDFMCLASWVENRSSCPLCNTALTAIEYDWVSPTDYLTYRVRPTSATSSSSPLENTALDRPRQNRWSDAVETSARNSAHHRGRADTYRPTGRTDNLRSHRHARQPSPLPPRSRAPRRLPIPADVRRRRFVYEHALFSLHVGANRISQYRNYTHHDMARDPELRARARRFIARELQAFAGHSPWYDSQGERREVNGAASDGLTLEYLMASLVVFDIKGSDGEMLKAAETLLGVPGLHGAWMPALFLHELDAWLRSPYMDLATWDRHVAYASPIPEGL